VRQALRAARGGLWLALVLAAQLNTATAIAGPFTRLQVVLPGEVAAPGTPSGKTGTPLPQTAGVPFLVTVNACDASWILVPTVTHSIQILSSDASASLPAPAQLVAGTGVFLVILNAGGNFTIYAHDQSDVTIPDGASSLVRSIVLQSLEFSNIAKHETAGTPFSITVTARDPNGVLVSGFTGAVRLRELTSFGEGRITPSTVTLTAGQWTGNVTAFRADETNINSGNVNLRAEVQAHPSQSGASNSFIVHPGPFRRVQIVTPGESPLPGSVSGIAGVPASQAAGRSFTVSVYGTDDYWNQVPVGDAVQVASSTDPADTPVSGNLSGGFRQFTFTLVTVGTQTVTVTDQTNTGITSMTSAGIQVIPNAADHFVFSTIASPQVAGVPFTITVRAADASGNTVFGYAGDAILAANTGAGTSIPIQITFVAGVWTGPVTLFGAGSSVRLTCSDFSVPPHTGTSGNITVNPGTFVKLQVILPGETARGGTADGKDGTPLNQTAGTPFSITVRAVDAYWNVVSGINDRVALTSTDAFAGMPAETTLVSGQLIFPGRLYKNGVQTISASDVDNVAILSNTSGNVTVVGGAFSRVLVLAPGESPAPGTVSGRTGTATDQSINYAFTLTVLATDQWWNPVAGPTDVVHITCNDPLAQVPADQAMVNGVASMNLRLSTGGFQQISVTDVTQPSKTGSTTQVRAISSGLHLEAAVTPSSMRAGEPFTLTVRATNDAGSVIQEINSFVTVTAKRASDGSPGQGTLLTSQFQLLQGQRSISQTYTFAEPIVIVATDDAGNAPATSNAITITPGTPSLIRLSSNPPWVGGNRHATITARVVDAFENGVPAQLNTWSVVAGTGTITSSDSISDGSGYARADFLSPRNPEKSTIRFSSGALTLDLDLDVAFIDPAAAVGTAYSFPNPFHPPLQPATIAWKIMDNATVTLRVFTQTGDLVLRKEFPSGGQGGQAGLNQFVWDGKNGKGEVVSSGGYIVMIEAPGTGVIRRRVAVVR
jgi:hypothetical protein